MIAMEVLRDSSKLLLYCVNADASDETSRQERQDCCCSGHGYWRRQDCQGAQIESELQFVLVL